MVYEEAVKRPMEGYSDMANITDEVAEIIARAGISTGLANVFAVGSTASITTIEYEPALVQDVKDTLENKIAGEQQPTRHGDTWGDDNGFSHIRATLMGPGITVPVSNGSPVLGTWQQVIVIDHDNRARTREIHVTVMGE